jgi:hypothetical protein
MTQTPPARPEPQQWYYSAGPEQIGPVSTDQLQVLLHNGGIHVNTLVRREGATDWFCAWAFPELVRRIKLKSTQPTPRQRREAQILRNARRNAVNMFVLLLVTAVMVAVNVTVYLLRPGTLDPLLPLWGMASLAGGVFATIYLPLRWRAIWRVGRPYNVLGLVGGIGLMTFFALYFLFCWLM